MKEIEIGKKTKKIDLSKKGLKSIPNEIFEITDLETLILEGNQIKSISDSISKLSKLKVLDVSNNKINKISDKLYSLVGLEKLNLSNNKLLRISPNIVKLEKLKSLTLFNNNLNIPPPEITDKENCKGSVFLYFEKFKEEQFNRHKLIWEIKWNLNETTKTLWVDDFKAKAFKDTFKNIKDPDSIWLDDIKIEDYEFQLKDVSSTQKKLDEYFKLIENLDAKQKSIIGEDLLFKINNSKGLTKTHKLFESKLIFVGEERAGKTSLIKSLTNGDFTLNINELSTQGIDITHWDVPKKEVKADNGFRLNIWDFGGQEIYHSTHQFFLTKRSIYIIVTEARKDVRHDDFYYWLNIIKHLGGQSPILIVTNKIDQPNTGIAVERFKDIFPTIVDEYRVSCLDEHKQTIVLLKKAIYNLVNNKKLLPHIGTPLPKVYVDIRDEINDLKDQGKLVISNKQYYEICEQYDLDESESDNISDFFHDLGVFLHFREDEELNNTIFLNFEFITKAVYNVLDNTQIIEQHGYFTPTELQKIWIEPEFLDKREDLLALMKNKRFDLCFELKDGRYLAPQLLPHKQPDFSWSHTAQRTLDFEIVYAFLPKGIISRLIVRLNDYVHNNLYWRYGVVLDYKNTKAFIEEQYFQRKIIVKVVGKASKKLLDIILTHIKEINSEFTNLEYEEMVPCNCISCLNRSNDTHFYKYSELKRFRIELNRETKECGLSGEQVNIDSLIKGTFLNNMRLNKRSGFAQDKLEASPSNSSSLLWITALFLLIGAATFAIIYFLNQNQAILWASIFVILFSLIGLFFLFDKKRLSEKGFLKGILNITKKANLGKEE